MHPPAPPPPVPRPPGGAPQGRDFLASPIGDVCENQVGVLPLNCFRPARGRVPSGHDLLRAGLNPPPVSQEMAEKLLSALASIINGDNERARLVTNAVTIRAFRNMTLPQQIAVINDIWNANTTPHRFTTPPTAMSDPEGAGIGGNGPLPSSLCPNAPGSNVFVKRLRGQPFREFGVGFRIDGSNAGSVARVTASGMTQQRLNEPFMLGPSRGLRLAGTVMADQRFARVWTGNDDIFNESAVCVSRNFFGATAFPLRETVGPAYLWAVNCTYLPGFDTEGHQIGLPNARQWRPGEKAFSFIPASRVIGYVEIQRNGAPPTGGWRFQIAPGATWTYINAVSNQQRAYIEAELAAWRGGNYTIPNTFDFATP